MIPFTTLSILGLPILEIHTKTDMCMKYIPILINTCEFRAVELLCLIITSDSKVFQNSWITSRIFCILLYLSSWNFMLS